MAARTSPHWRALSAGLHLISISPPLAANGDVRLTNHDTRFSMCRLGIQIFLSASPTRWRYPELVCEPAGEAAYAGIAN